jgi:hypothetical protein
MIFTESFELIRKDKIKISGVDSEGTSKTSSCFPSGKLTLLLQAKTEKMNIRLNSLRIGTTIRQIKT